MKADTIFKEKLNKSSDFRFDSAVVNVFDDMVIRSVPYYLEFQRMIAEMAGEYAVPDTSLYDLGCSTGTTFITLNTQLDPSIQFVGIDDSREMIDKCRKNLESSGMTRLFRLEEMDLNKPVIITNASVVVLCLTLQFVRPIHRQGLIDSIYRQLNTGGCLIVVEKVLGESTVINREFISHYYDFKRRNNYDDLEIAQKREALENVLIPYKVSENIQLIMDSGFHSCEAFFKWYNFAGFLAIK